MPGGVSESLAKLQDSGYFLFLISNQPNVAKGEIDSGRSQKHS
jgi:histidinol phosphatase-like enzyme